MSDFDSNFFAHMAYQSGRQHYDSYQGHGYGLDNMTQGWTPFQVQPPFGTILKKLGEGAQGCIQSMEFSNAALSKLELPSFLGDKNAIPGLFNKRG